MQENREGGYYINHRYKDEIIIPMRALTNNMQFFLDKGEREVLMGDGSLAKVISCEEVHICELETEINQLYNMTPWNFIKRWHKVYPVMSSMFFLKMKLTKDEM